MYVYVVRTATLYVYITYQNTNEITGTGLYGVDKNQSKIGNLL